MIYLVPLIIVLTTRPQVLEAQDKHPLIISGGTHALTVPWYPGPVADRMNPSLAVGTERTLRTWNTMRLYQTGNVGFFRHYWWITGVYVDTEAGISSILPWGCNADLRIGIGYLHYFWRREILTLDDGRYVRKTDWGRPSAMIPVSVIFGYRGGSFRSFTISPFITAQWIIQTPFTNEIPAMTHLLMHIGIRIGRSDRTSEKRK